MFSISLGAQREKAQRILLPCSENGVWNIAVYLENWTFSDGWPTSPGLLLASFYTMHFSSFNFHSRLSLTLCIHFVPQNWIQDRSFTFCLFMFLRGRERAESRLLIHSPNAQGTGNSVWVSHRSLPQSVRPGHHCCLPASALLLESGVE